MNVELPKIPVATHYFRQRYLFAFATQAEVLHHLRTQALEEESDRLPEIIRAWSSLQPRVDDLVQRESGLADTIRAAPLPDEYRPRLEAFASDPLFRKTFSTLPISFGLVEIDKLVAPQRTVNLDYVDRLLASYPRAVPMAGSTSRATLATIMVGRARWEKKSSPSIRAGPKWKGVNGISYSFTCAMLKRLARS